jgi:hypothetical protein
MVVGLNTRPNKPDAVNPAMALWFAVEDQWRRVTDLERWPSNTMKLEHFATFVFRVLGALLIFSGVWSIFLLLTVSEIKGEPRTKAIAAAVLVWGLGGYLVYYSKVVAAIFCKDIDDDSG